MVDADAWQIFGKYEIYITVYIFCPPPLCSKNVPAPLRIYVRLIHTRAHRYEEELYF